MKRITITPDLARYYLTKNITNRNIDKPRVKKYAEQMLLNKWLCSPIEGIGFDIHGRLIDGQHRLSAIVLADIPVDFYVFEDLSPDLLKVIDTGKARTPGDVLKIHNVENSNNIASGIRLRHKIEKGVFGNQGNADINLSNQEVLEQYNSRPEYWQELFKKSKRLYKHSLQIITPQAVLGMMSYWVDKGEQTTFIEAVLEDDHNVLNAKGLNKFLTNQKIKRIKVTQADVLRLFFKYHDFWKTNRKANQFQLLPEEKVKIF